MMVRVGLPRLRKGGVAGVRLGCPRFGWTRSPLSAGMVSGGDMDWPVVGAYLSTRRSQGWLRRDYLPVHRCTRFWEVREQAGTRYCHFRCRRVPQEIGQRIRRVAFFLLQLMRIPASS